jgi:hypothetical protein
MEEGFGREPNSVKNKKLIPKAGSLYLAFGITLGKGW